MTEDHFKLLLDEPTDVEEVVLGFRLNGEFHELVSVSPPVEAILRER
ncbi:MULTISPECIES: hypothetical protein [Haloferax]|uniref:Uncharacterized protein n=1 Tax=Haloferax marinisediminis TaxID=2666142 RepID=A0A6G1Z0C8_9EURY|nr:MULTISPECIES: hypothetical protein [Haloferax]MRW79945.1 hypothetical protein [Haloferax marinisediminis]